MKMHKLLNRYSLSCTCTFAIAGLLWFSFQPEQQSAPSSEAYDLKPAPSKTERVQEAMAINLKTHRLPLAELPKPGPLPAYLQGAEPNVSLHSDEHGDLVLDSDLIVLFDFFLSALEEEPLETVLARIHHALDHQLNGNALSQAQELLRRYVDYRIGLAELDEQSPHPMATEELSAQALRERYQNLKALRQSLFSSEESTAFFYLDSTQDEYMLQRLSIGEDSSLSASQRQQAIAALDQQLPEEIRALRRRVTQHAELYAHTETLQQAGATQDQIYQVRAEALGDEAATNLAQLDRSRAQWKQRLSDYAREKANILQSGLSQADQKAAIASLIESRFTELERLRVRALTTQ